MVRKIEDTICKEVLPVNTIAFLNRAKEILDENKTNCAKSLKGNGLAQYRKILWFLTMQIHGELNVVDSVAEWCELCSKSKE